MSFPDVRKPATSKRALLARVIVIVGLVWGLGGLFLVAALGWNLVLVTVVGSATGCGFVVQFYRRLRM